MIFNVKEEEKYKSGLYVIINKITKKIYIGSTNNFRTRFLRHKNNLLNNKHKNSHLQNSVNKYGLNNFEFKPLDIIEPRKLKKIETYYIHLFDCTDREVGYNICPTATNTTLGLKLSEETKEKMSRSKLEFYSNPDNVREYSEQEKDILRTLNLGRKWTAKQKKNMGHKGEKNHKSKLNSEDVLNIRELLKQNITLIKIAKIYNISIQSVWGIKIGKNWKHI